MADPHLKSTLERKALEIESSIEEYRRIVSDNQNKLVHLRGTIAIFEDDRVHRVSSPYVSLAGVFKRGETFAIIRRALTEHPDGLDTRELADRCMAAKGLDASDKMLRRSMMQSIAQMLQVRKASGQVAAVSKRGLTCVWQLSRGTETRILKF